MQVTTPLPQEFINRIQDQIQEAPSFFEKLEQEAPTSIRLNSGKKSFATSCPNGKAIPWNEDALMLNERTSFILDPNYHSGLYYPMEASSLFLKQALVCTFSADAAIDILDLCAAPGGKSLILKDYFSNGVLVSNEIDEKRVHILKENAIRWGTENHIIIQSDAPRIRQSKLLFDLILVDAPCSGEGLFRKDKKSRSEWTLEKASGCATRQTNILKDVVPLLKPGGYLIYSTCTYNPEENEQQINSLKNEFGFRSVPIPLDKDWGVEEIQNNDTFSYQFWAHKTIGEGFFIAILQAPRSESIISYAHRTKRTKSHPFPYLRELELSDYLIQQYETKYFAYTEQEIQFSSALLKSSHFQKKGIYLGEVKGGDFIPSYDLAMNVRSLKFKNQLELNREEGLQYLAGNALNLQAGKGPILLTYQGLGIGFGKSNGTRINNLYPKHLRIKVR